MKKVLLLCIMLLSILVLTNCQKKEISFKILVPSGAPALAQAKFHKEEISLGVDVKYTIDLTSGASTIPGAFSSEEYEIIFAPTNIGAKMYNNNQKYVYVANVTWGNLFFATASEGEFTISSLNNKKVNLFGEGTINEIVINKIFAENNISISSDSTYESGTDITRGLLVTNPNAIVLIAEPILSATTTALLQQGKTVKTLSVQDLWKEVTNADSYPQAGVYVQKVFFDKNKAIVEKYLSELKSSCEFVESNASEVAQYALDLEYGLPIPAILTKAIPNCNIYFKTAKESKTALENVFALDLSQIGGKLPDDDFYAY